LISTRNLKRKKNVKKLLNYLKKLIPLKIDVIVVRNCNFFFKFNMHLKHM
jgi:hypothetical protein